MADIIIKNEIGIIKADGMVFINEKLAGLIFFKRKNIDKIGWVDIVVYDKNDREIGYIKNSKLINKNGMGLCFVSSSNKLYRIERGILATLNKKGHIIDAHGIPACQCEGKLNLEVIAIYIFF